MVHRNPLILRGVTKNDDHPDRPVCVVEVSGRGG
jgi:hypothetical protein